MDKYTSSLQHKLNQVKKIINVNKLINFRIDKKYIKRYYFINKLPYSFFHSSKYIHFAISRDGIYKKEDLEEEAKFISSYIEELKARLVLELACGRAGNSIYLAKRYEDITFYCLDLSKAQLSYAKKKSKKLTNIKIILGDYHYLERFNNKFDIVFITEALCYSTKKNQVFKQVKRILRKNGIMIIIDGYWRNHNNNFSPLEFKIKKLMELGMALQEFEPHERVIKKAQIEGFTVVYKKDISKFLLPNAYRFENMVKWYISRPILCKFIKHLTPDKFTNNVLFGYFVCDAIQAGWGEYYITVLKKSK